ncbi:MAG: ABC-type Fe3+-hydroxamate transport system substrate-binding protein, partial [Planctomycetota bacterium]
MLLRFLTLLAATSLGLLQAGCTGEAPPSEKNLHTISLGKDQTLEIPVHVTRVVPANGAVLDFCAALVGPDRMAALPKASLRYSNIPDAERGPWEELPVMDGLHLEDLASAQVDLVIAHDWQEPSLAPVLARAGIPVLFLPTVSSADDIFRSMHWVSLVFDVADKGVEQNTRLRSQAAALVENGKSLAGTNAMVYSNYGVGGG